MAFHDQDFPVQKAMLVHLDHLDHVENADYKVLKVLVVNQDLKVKEVIVDFLVNPVYKARKESLVVPVLMVFLEYRVLMVEMLRKGRKASLENREHLVCLELLLIQEN